MKFIIELSANETQKAIEQGIILDLITKASEKVSTAPAAPQTPATPQPVAPTAPVTPVAPVTPATSAMSQPAPVAPTAPTTPVAPAAPQPAPAPTTSATFTVEQLATAAMQLKDQGRIGELQNLLAQFGVASLVQLSPEQLPVFAQSLQAVGVKL